MASIAPLTGFAELETSLRTPGQAWETLRSLTDEVGARYPGTPGEVASEQWAERVLTRSGLSNVRREAVPATLWRRGAESGQIVLTHRRPVVLSALGGSVATPRGGIDAPVVEVESLDALDRLTRADVEGKIVFLHHVMPRRRDGTGYNEGSVARTSGPSRAARLGAVAFLVRSIGTDSQRAAHTGALWYEPGVPEIPAAALSIPDAGVLHRVLQSGSTVRFALDLDCAPLPVGQSHNILAELPGTDLADEIVLIGSHLDSWDLGTGALDDGAGCAIAIEVARRIAALPTRPRRTIRVVLFANEELGAGGGRSYATTHANEAARHFVALEADQGDGKPWALRVPAAARTTGAAGRLATALASVGIELDAGASRGGVDIGPLRQLGVPFIDLRQDATRYFDFHHTANDVLENVNRDEIESTASAFTLATWVLANMPESLRGAGG